MPSCSMAARMCAAHLRLRTVVNFDLHAQSERIECESVFTCVHMCSHVMAHESPPVIFSHRLQDCSRTIIHAECRSVWLDRILTAPLCFLCVVLCSCVSRLIYENAFVFVITAEPGNQTGFFACASTGCWCLFVRG